MRVSPLCRLFFMLALMSAPSVPMAAPVVQLRIEGAIGPASADYVVRGLSRAVEQGAQLAVLSLDTPGGLDTSMRAIIKAILASPIPVASYVAPSGARAASAGTYILYASHIAAMAPGTNLGAATPVAIGGMPGSPTPDQHGDEGGAEQPASSGDTLSHKQVNDAAAYIRSLAQLRGRNVEWAERAVREAVSLPAEEALQIQVVDYVAESLPRLLERLDGKSFTAAGREVRLHTAGAAVIEQLPDWRTRLLAVITNPSVALLLMMVGVYGLIFEFANPGSGIGGVLGGISLVLALYALQLLPVNYAGVALIMLGIGFIVAEALLPSFGVLGIGGVAAFCLGAVILIDTEVPGFGIPLALVLTLGLASVLMIFAIVGMAVRARRRAVFGGDNELLGNVVEVYALQQDPHDGWVELRGERWQVHSRVPLRPGQQVRVLARRGMLLEVTAVEELLT